jgi:D-3-phosphoglycerate dehydrogenase
MTEVVLVTPRSMTADPPASLALLEAAGARVVLGPAGRQPDRADLERLLPSATAWIAGVEPVDAGVLALAPDLHTISRNGVGVDSIDATAAGERGIRIMSTPGANADGVAELSIALLLNLLRGVDDAAQHLRNRVWQRGPGRELGSATLGVVGLGAIGSRVARIATGFGARVLGVDPWASDEIAAGVEVVGLDEMLAAADAVSLHVPGPVDGAPVIGERELALLAPEAVLVNTARWSVADPDAVLRALEGRHLAGYAIDAFAEEPPLPHLLLAHPRVLATPHLGAFTRESAKRAADAAVANVLAVLSERSVDAPR